VNFASIFKISFPNNSEEFADLFRKRDALYGQIIDGLSQEKKSVLLFIA